jgi:hypothetical protein
VEDWLTSKAAEVSGVINTATAPVTLTVSQKKALFAWVVEMKFLRDR